MYTNKIKYNETEARFMHILCHSTDSADLRPAQGLILEQESHQEIPEHDIW